MRILYICDGNVARSQEAELFTNALSEGKHTASSAGVNPTIGKPIDPLVVEVMAEQGYSIGKNHRKLVDKHMIGVADLIISFKPASELPAFVHSHPNLHYWDIADPRGQSLDFHRKTRDLIKNRVASLLREIGDS